MMNSLANPASASAALAIVRAIESGNGEIVPHLMQQWVVALGGMAPLHEMTPEGKLLYLLALLTSRG